jgi:diguanylate cyclase (GGDEF)-like protein
MNFFKTISNSTDFFINSQEAIAFIADDLKIAKVEAIFKINKQYKKISGNDYSKVLYSSDIYDYDDDNVITYTAYTPTIGDITYKAYLIENSEPLTFEERDNIDFVLENINLVVSKMKLTENVDFAVSRDIDTGVMNMAAFYKFIQRILENGEAGNYASVFLNVKGMKYYNESYGMNVGNMILSQFAKTLYNFCDKNEAVCRLGGDNFAMFIRKTKKTQIEEKLKAIPIELIVRNKKIKCMLSAYAGYAEVKDEKATPNQVIQPANNAYCHAKYVEKVDFMEYNEEIDNIQRHQKEVMTAFMPALKTGDMKVYYQPKVELETYRLCGAEALSRWEYNGELKSPYWYIPVLEQTNAICELDIYNFELVCRDIREWLDQGITPVRISINFSRRHLTVGNLTDRLVEIMNRYNIPKEYIEVEITETTDEAEYGTLVAFIDELRKNNIVVSIDDFGTGFSSLNILKDIPVDIIKLDKSFLDKTQFVDRMSILVSDLVQMAKDLNIKTVSEGVETKSQAKFLAGINCDIAQGYYFDKPLPHDKFTEQLKKGVYEKN